MSDDKRDQRDSSFDRELIALDNESNGAETSEDKELRQLLESWRAPVVAASHERRLVEAYRQQQSEQGADAAALRQNNKEVAKMKTCTTCHEEFADKFSFCPVDGTPLNGLNAGAVDPVLTSVEEPVTMAANTARVPTSGDGNPSSADGNGKYVLGDGGFAAQDNAAPSAAAGASVGASAAAASNNEYHLTMIEDAGLVNRLTTELREVAQASQLTWPEFKRDPVGFTRRSAAAYGTLTSRFFRRPNVALACLIAIFTVISAIIIIGLLDRRPQVAQTEQERVDQLLDFSEVQEIPEEQKPVEKGNAGMNKGKGGGSKQKQERPSGGGGGGQEQQKPVSQGKPPQASLDVPPIVRPPVTPPAIKNPKLPTPVTIDLDPMLARNNLPPMPYGDLKSKSTDPSAGEGSNGGLGNGKGLGAGPGEGGGLGPGRGGNVGGGDRGLGGGGPGGGGGGAPVDYNRVFSGKEVTRKAVVLNKPEPQYTEDARKNQIMGTVTLKIVLAANGQVTNIRSISGLPNGLTEKAIEAAHLIKFTPAMKDGHPVSQYTNIQFVFTIY